MSYEDVFFYLDLLKENLKKKDLTKAIKLYIEEKNKTNIKGHYGILMFQKEGNPIFITDKKESGAINKAIDESWKLRPKESYFENGLFYIFSYIAETVRKKSKNNRVIIITDTPSDLNAEYQEALFNIVSKIKHFPTFIDVIRISAEGTRLHKDDVKLNILASDTKGGIFYCSDKKEFLGVINKLVKNKQLVSTFMDQPDELKISSEDYDFYSNLAKELVKKDPNESVICYFCKEAICPVCVDAFDTPSKCPECGAAFHNCCVTNFTISHNIGIPHIFRCPKCDVLLQIDQSSIVQVDEGADKEFKEFIEREPSVIEEKDLSAIPSPELTPIPSSSSDAPKIIEDNEFAAPKPDLSPIPQDGTAKQVRVGGFFGKVYVAKKVGNKIVYQRTNQSAKSQQASKEKVNICPVCGVTIKPRSTKCSNCGNSI